MTTSPKVPEAAATSTAVSDYTTAMGEVKAGLVERDVEVDLIFACLIARVHPLFIGERGVAKSMMTDALISHVGADLQKFERLLAKDTPSEEVLGPPNLAALEHGSWERVIDHKIQTAHVAFLDEIFKANSTVLNALLKIINERVFYNNGARIDVPLMMLVGASNELPGHDRDDLAAFRDRFGICKVTQAVRTHDGMRGVLEGQLGRLAAGSLTPPAHTMFTLEQVELLQQAVANVTVPESVKKDYVDLRARAEQENLQPSLRRMFEGLRVAMARAVLRGEDTLAKSDLSVMEHVLWTDPEDHKVAYELTLEYAGQTAQRAAALRTEYEPILQELNELKPIIPADGNMSAELSGSFGRVNMLLKNLGQRVEKARDEAADDGQDTAPLDELANQVNEQRTFIKNEALGFAL